MVLNCGVDASELWCWGRLLRVPWTPRRSNQSIKGNQSWIFVGRTDAEAEAPILWPPDKKNWLIRKDQPWCWERLKAGGERDDRGWDGWMASSTRWTWIWVDSGSWWWKGKPGVLQSMWSQRARHDWVTELNWTDGPWHDFDLASHITYTNQTLVHYVEGAAGRKTAESFNYDFRNYYIS